MLRAAILAAAGMTAVGVILMMAAVRASGSRRRRLLSVGVWLVGIGLAGLLLLPPLSPAVGQ